jgi:hypothetical protein
MALRVVAVADDDFVGIVAVGRVLRLEEPGDLYCLTMLTTGLTRDFDVGVFCRRDGVEIMSGLQTPSSH